MEFDATIYPFLRHTFLRPNARAAARCCCLAEGSGQASDLFDDQGFVRASLGDIMNSGKHAGRELWRRAESSVGILHDAIHEIASTVLGRFESEAVNVGLEARKFSIELARI
jgi:hypothetical protein